MSIHSAALLPSPAWPGASFYDVLARRILLWKYGSQGRVCAEHALEQAVSAAGEDSRFLGPAAGMAFWMWQQRPLHAGLLETLLSLERLSPFLPAGTRAALASLIKFKPLLNTLDAAWQAAWDKGEPARCRELVDRTLPPPLARHPSGLGDRLLAQALLYDAEYSAQGTAPTLLHVLDSLDAAPAFAAWAAVARAFLLREAGDPDGAARSLLPAWRAMPWHVNLACVLHDLLHLPHLHHSAQAPLRGSATAQTLAMSRHTVVCLYTWNKARPLTQALDALAGSDLGEARVLLLDNGSSDATPAVIEEYARRAPHPVDILTLPVNIGAPAARNWLLVQPAVQAARQVAFLDDDAIVPPHWLWAMLETAARHSGAGVVGCQIVGPRPPYPLQAADFHLLPPALCPSGFADLRERIHILDNGLGEAALGLFAYERPCATVTGCCHLLTEAALRHPSFRVSRFDIAFSPSQFDDAARDLHGALAGLPAVCCGGLRVRHLQHSSLSQAKTPFQEARIRANKAAMELQFRDEDVLRLAQEDAARTLDHLARVLNRLEALDK
ncbi:glycosyltransferase [Megalodesulfovibrio paquesii]